MNTDFIKGVVVPMITPIDQDELIDEKAIRSQVDYVRARPIHSSQEEVEQGYGWSVFSYWLRPSYNFYQMLLWHREKVEVMEPEEVREEMKKIVNQISKQYNIYG